MEQVMGIAPLRPKIRDIFAKSKILKKPDGFWLAITPATKTVQWTVS